MQHETLTMNFDADPFDVSIYLWVCDVDGYHEPIYGLVVVRLVQGIVVKVAVGIT